MIAGRKMLAKTSSTPGKTQLINHFLINDEWYLVDLPGYGYARTAKSTRDHWSNIIEQYLLRRQNLMSAFLLLDSRLPLQTIDRKIINWFGENQIHFTLVLTKTDKLSTNKLTSNFEAIKKDILTDWEELPSVILSSSISMLGREEILTFIGNTNQLFIPVKE
jgi:GTP-binding protein